MNQKDKLSTMRNLIEQARLAPLAKRHKILNTMSNLCRAALEHEVAKTAYLAGKKPKGWDRRIKRLFKRAEPVCTGCLNPGKEVLVRSKSGALCGKCAGTVDKPTLEV